MLMLRRRRITTRDDTWIIRRECGEDHNSVDRKNDEHRDRNAGAIAHCGHYAEPKKSPANDGGCSVLSAGDCATQHQRSQSHYRPQELTAIQFKGMCKYVLQPAGAFDPPKKGPLGSGRGRKEPVSRRTIQVVAAVGAAVAAT